MNADLFFQKFDLLSDAPGAVAKMRELILHLATTGTLVEQSPEDESAALLLKKIDAHISELRSKKQFRGAKVPSPQTAALPNIPSSWEWVSLGNIVDYGSSEKAESEDIAADAWLLDLEDIEKDTSRLIQKKRFKDNPSKSTKTAFAAGDVLYGKLRPYLNKVLIANEPGFCTTEIIPIKTFGNIVPEYLCIALKRPDFIAYANSKSYGMNLPRLGTDDARSAPFPLPPLAEQKRIVAKVDELMALCDRLEARHKERDERHGALSRAALARFADAPTPDNLALLFHPDFPTPSADLRKTILSLAVQGKLVPQDPNDEPAEELLKKIDSGLSASDQKRRAEKLPPIDQESAPHLIPSGWTWARFRDIAIIASNLVKPESYQELPHLAPDNIEKGNGTLLPCRTVREDKVISSNHRFFPGQIVYSKIRPNLAKVVIVDFDGLCSADMYPIDALIDARYIQKYMLSETFLTQAVKNDTRVAMPKINQTELNCIAVPTPPLAEQRRIVAKVDELTALVDRLEAAQSAARAAAPRLLDAAVADLLAG